MSTLAVLTMLVVAGCGTTSAPIDYTPQEAGLRRGTPVVAERLESNQVARREAKVHPHFVWRRGDGSATFENDGTADVVTGSLVTFEAGIFGSVDALRATVAQAFSEAIDQALDDPALVEFLARRRG